MKYGKKLIVFLMCAMFAVTACACGSSRDTVNETDGTTDDRDNSYVNDATSGEEDSTAGDAAEDLKSVAEDAADDVRDGVDDAVDDVQDGVNDMTDDNGTTTDRTR